MSTTKLEVSSETACGMAGERVYNIYDLVVFCGTVGLSFFIGIYFGWKNRNKDSVENYFLADRKLSVLPTALSLAVTFQSSLLIIGVPAEVYIYGLKYAYYLIGVSLSYTFAGLFIAPVIHPLKLTSANKYFRLRFNDNILRYFVMSLGIFYYILYSGSVIFGTCVALEFLMGIPYWGTILIYSVITAIYTSVGGMKGVIWTDVLQIMIMAMGVTALIAKSCLEVGGMSNVLRLASSRLNMNDFRIDPTIRYQFWNLTFGSFMSTLVTCFQQPGIQRINSTPSIVSARRLCALSGVLNALLAFCVCFEGVSIFALYSYRRCDPLSSGRIQSTNQLIPLAVSDLFSSIPGLSGLFIAALSSAALSTLSSSLSSLGAVTYDDIIREKYPDMSERNATRISKIVVFLYGMLAMGFTNIIALVPGTILSVTYAFMGCVDGPTCALFIVSVLYKKATTKGLMSGALAGIVCILWLNLGSIFGTVKPTPTLPAASVDYCLNETTNYNISFTVSLPTKPSMNSTFVSLNESVSPDDVPALQQIYSISFMLYPWIGFIVTVLVAIPMSWLTSPPQSFDQRCLFSFKKHVSKQLFAR